MNKLIIEEYKNNLGIDRVSIIESSPTCELFLELSDKFLISSQKLSEAIAEKIFDSILEVVAKDEDHYTDEEIELFNIVTSFCEKKAVKKNEEREKRVNRNLSRIAKRRWIRYREKYKRALKRAQESFENKPCQKNIKALLKKESYDRSDVYNLIKAMNSSVTHYLIYNEISEKTQDTQLPSELLEELNELNYNLFKESNSLLESKEVNQSEFQDLVLFANEVFCNCDNQLSFNS